MTVFTTIFDEMISPERLFEAWYEFRKGKGNRRDVQEFGRHAEEHIFRLHRDLASGAYRHSPSLNHGIDFLGIVVHPFHRTLRTTTKRRMLRKLAERHGEACRGEVDSGSLNQSLQSYLGILSHVDGHGLSTLLKNGFCLLSALSNRSRISIHLPNFPPNSP